MFDRLKVLLAWLIAATLAYALASVAHTQTILAGLGALGVHVGLDARLATTLGDLAGLWRYALVIGLALGLGLPIVEVAGRKLPSPVRGALGGGLAVACALLAMKLAFSITPIASARGAIGFALQCLAGTAGGLAYAWSLERLR